MSREVRQRVRIRVTGVVQGVGFRPFVFLLARRYGLAGSVHNTTCGVEIDAEGGAGGVEDLLTALRDEAPPLARVSGVVSEEVPLMGAASFRMAESALDAGQAALISPDASVCSDCLAELDDPGDRRYGYPFINCTNCGPRFTVVESLPYDRERTTMRCFPLCPDCDGEYGDPENRRFHAEPNACPACGPQLSLLAPGGSLIAGGDRAMAEARALFCAGKIVAVKGLGGYHLACNAADDNTVARLRRRKGRPHKPLVVMCRDRSVAESYCSVSPEEMVELTGPRRPILLLRLRECAGRGLTPVSSLVAPGHHCLGVMLPYTPLHRQLFAEGTPPCLVMTSGNISGEPIVTDNDEAVRMLGQIADAFLIHDRPVANRCDDSVGMMTGQRLVLLRRSRGFVPLPVELPRSVGPILALGAMTSTTFVLCSGRRAFLSQHIGDVDNLETQTFLEESIERFGQWLGIEPETVAHDMHPDLLTTRLAQRLSGRGCRAVPVQHHHAHLVSAAIAAGVEGEVIGLVLDGNGWGPDGTVWGGELLVGSATGYVRAGHFRPLPLPGGDRAIRRPLALALSWLQVLAPWAVETGLDLWKRTAPGEAEVVHRMVERGINTPLTTSAGRLFDAVAAILGVRDSVTYQGQAAIELEQLAGGTGAGESPRLGLEVAEKNGRVILDPGPLLSGLVNGLLDGVDRARLAMAFHLALAEALAEACLLIREDGGPLDVVLCGGVFQNRILTRLTVEALDSSRFNVIPPGLIPVNDGGLALGQAVIAGADAGADRAVR